jgi:hypothetical protein
MMRTLLLWALLSGLWATTAVGQKIRFRLDLVGLTYQEGGNEGFDLGSGVGGAVDFRLKRFLITVDGHAARMVPEDDGAVEYDFAQFDVRLGYEFTPFLALQVGGQRRYVRPEFAAQEVGMLSVGVLSENQLNRISSVWLRGAYLINPQFSGGGQSELSFDFGLGVAVGTANGRFRGSAEYNFQRIDRQVDNAGVPIQVSVARLGIALGF